MGYELRAIRTERRSGIELHRRGGHQGIPPWTLGLSPRPGRPRPSMTLRGAMRRRSVYESENGELTCGIWSSAFARCHINHTGPPILIPHPVAPTATTGPAGLFPLRPGYLRKPARWVQVWPTTATPFHPHPPVFREVREEAGRKTSGRVRSVHPVLLGMGKVLLRRASGSLCLPRDCWAERTARGDL